MRAFTEFQAKTIAVVDENQDEMTCLWHLERERERERGSAI